MPDLVMSRFSGSRRAGSHSFPGSLNKLMTLVGKLQRDLDEIGSPNEPHREPHKTPCRNAFGGMEEGHSGAP